MQGGGLGTFYNSSVDFRGQAILSTSPVALQLYIDGLGMGALVQLVSNSALVG